MALLTSKPASRKGYTLIELIVVLALFSLLLSMTLPNSAFIRNLNERQELRMLEKDLRQARSSAIIENRTVMVSFYRETNEYIIRYSEREVIKRHFLKSGLRIVDRGSDAYYFNGTGRVGNANTVRIRKSDGRLYEIAIAPVTTEITLREGSN